jgi:hypothetical protein
MDKLTGTRTSVSITARATYLAPAFRQLRLASGQSKSWRKSRGCSPFCFARICASPWLDGGHYCNSDPKRSCPRGLPRRGEWPETHFVLGGDGTFQLLVVILEDSNFGRILTWLPALASSGQLKTQRLRRFHTTHIRIETDPPCRFHGDGEILGMTPVEVSIVPRAIRVLRPAQKSMG